VILEPESYGSPAGTSAGVRPCQDCLMGATLQYIFGFVIGHQDKAIKSNSRHIPCPPADRTSDAVEQTTHSIHNGALEPQP